MDRRDVYDSPLMEGEHYSASQPRSATAKWVAQSPLARFEAKIKKTESCWLWKASLRPNGYGQFWDGHRLVSAHRFAYEAYRGPIAQGLVIDHVCRNRLCVNPDHLEAVSARENALRTDSPPARNATKTHCDRGHKFTPRNTYIRGDGSRECRACREKNRLYDRSDWREVRQRVIARDGHCVLGWLFDGECEGHLQVHHVIPVKVGGPELDEENLVTLCQRHHPMVEALRRALMRELDAAQKKCPHRHTNRVGREACERSLNAAA